MLQSTKVQNKALNNKEHLFGNNYTIFATLVNKEEAWLQNDFRLDFGGKSSTGIALGQFQQDLLLLI